MDSVRFGRALGMGARSAAKALAVAADAATSSSPGPIGSRPAAPIPAASRPASRPASGAERVPASGPSAAGSQVASAARSAAHASIRARKASEGVARGSKRFGRAIWGPLVKVSGVLWLEITGAFFGIFALFAGQAAWAHRVELYSTSATRDDRVRALVFVAMATIFGYFCVSSFVRARRRERRG